MTKRRCPACGHAEGATHDAYTRCPKKAAAGVRHLSVVPDSPATAPSVTDRVTRGAAATMTPPVSDETESQLFLVHGGRMLDQFAEDGDAVKLTTFAGVIEDAVHDRGGAGVWQRARDRMRIPMLQTAMNGADTPHDTVTMMFADIDAHEEWNDVARSVHKAAVVTLLRDALAHAHSPSTNADAEPPDGGYSPGDVDEGTRECEECFNLVSHLQPCYDWDSNSMMVCSSCHTAINAAHPDGDPT